MSPQIGCELMPRPQLLIKGMMMARLKTILNEAGDSAELHILDDIGPSWAGMVGAKGIGAELKALGSGVKHLDVRVNSLGGDVFEGFAIYNLLKDHASDITVHVDGVAASAASVIVMAGDKIVMAQNSFLMIHDAYSILMGNAAELRRQADLLDSINAKIADVYAARGNKDSAAFAQLMDDESWLTAEEAVALGLADEIDANKTATFNSLSFRNHTFQKLPEAINVLPKPPMPEQERPPLKGRLEAWKALAERIGK